MKKLTIILFLLIILLVAGCSSKSSEPKVGDTLEGFGRVDNSADETPQEIDTRDSNQLKFVETCDFLSALDVQTICGTDVKMTKLDEMYGPCTFRFENDEEHFLRLIYYAYPPTDTKERGYNYCIDGQGGEEFVEFVCATPDDKNVYVFGDYYSISLGEEYDYPTGNVCEYEQIKELGKFVKEKIYG